MDLKMNVLLSFWQHHTFAILPAISSSGALLSAAYKIIYLRKTSNYSPLNDDLSSNSIISKIDMFSFALGILQICLTIAICVLSYIYSWSSMIDNCILLGSWTVFIMALSINLCSYSNSMKISAIVFYALSSTWFTVHFLEYCKHPLNSQLIIISLQLIFSYLLFFVNLLGALFSISPSYNPPHLGRRESKENKASIFSKLTFFWLNDLIKTGNQRPLEDEDLWELKAGDQSKNIFREYSQFKNLSPNRTLLYNIFCVIWPLLTAQLFCAVCTSILGFSGPFFLYRIVNFVQNPNSEYSYGMLLLLGMFSCAVVKAVLDGQMYFIGRRSGVRTRSILINEIYNKALKRANGASSTTDPNDEQASLGKIVTLMSVDTERILQFICYAHQLLVNTPLSIIIAIGSLFLVLGWSALVSLVILIVTSPLGTYIGKTVAKIQETQMEFTDQRVNIMNEILQGIRIIKYFAWEKQFAKRVDEVRENELRTIVKLWGAYIAFQTVGYGGGIIVAFSTFVVYTIVFGNTLDAATAFTAINLLHVVSGLLSFLPHEIMQIYKAKVSVDRIVSFLSEEELQKYINDGNVDLKGKSSYLSLDSVYKDTEDSDTLFGESDIPVGFRRAKFVYYGDKGYSMDKLDVSSASDDTASNPSEGVIYNAGFTLSNLNIEFPVGGLSVICGSTGSGKSSLILALLGEMKRINGDHYLPDSRNPDFDHESGLSNSVAYASQSAWLLNATIRDNILFGQPFDSARYLEVIRACSLARDLETLSGGDLTEIGEKGVNVSGGQKQRISLARACYSKARFVLLDDPLSAVDAPTARFLVDHAIRRLLKGRTCILVSHAVSLVLPFADYVVAIKNGEILAQGHPTEVVENPKAESVYGIDLKANVERDEIIDRELASQAPIKLPETIGSTLVDAEEKATGSVRFAVYKSYFVAAGGIFFVLLYILSFIISSVTQFGNDWWLKTWTDSTSKIPAIINMTLPLAIGKIALFNDHFTEFKQKINNPAFFPLPQDGPFSMGSNISEIAPTAISASAPNVFFYISIYGLFGLAVITTMNIQTLVTLFGSLMASRKMHKELLNNVLGAPLRFFEVTPIGRILNRFSKDIEQVDGAVMESVNFFLVKVIQGITILIVISSVVPPFLIVVVPVIFVYMWIAKLYLKTSRELKRLDAVSRSPIYAQFSETLVGATTIRAYGSESRFLSLNEEKVDSNHRAFFYLWAANRWLCFRTDLISALVVLFAGIGVMSGQLGAGWAGLVLTYALDFTQALLWTVRMHAEMEMSLNSVERVQEYSTIEQEPPAHIEATCPVNINGNAWPSEGRIVVNNLKIRYANDQPDVLKGISFDAKPCEKIAVVGRTGAGKSTLSLAFFRIIPLSGGSICIDDVDISTLGLADLRSRLTIIPQDPVLFSGTLRSNLDPLNEHDDSELWQALKRVRLLDSMQTNEDGESGLSLESPVSENGNNFSQGQRQLLCLARALLRRTKIIFLDEATASVDNETDSKIQETIREEFVQGTVLCIAHRLRTIIDYDRILVLDKGYVAEFGTPIDLIEKSPVGIFRKMVEETGEFEELVEIARKSSKKNDLIHF